MEDGGAAQYLVVHGDLEGKAQVVAEALLAGDVQADFLRGRGRVHCDGQALPRRQDDVHRDVLPGLDGLGEGEAVPWLQGRAAACGAPAPWPALPQPGPSRPRALASRGGCGPMVDGHGGARAGCPVLSAGCSQQAVALPSPPPRPAMGTLSPGTRGAEKQRLRRACGSCPSWTLEHSDTWEP